MSIIANYMPLVMLITGIVFGFIISLLHYQNKLQLLKKSVLIHNQKTIGTEKEHAFAINVLENELARYKEEYNKVFISKLRLIYNETPEVDKEKINKELEKFLKDHDMGALLDIGLILTRKVNKQFEDIVKILEQEEDLKLKEMQNG